MVSVDYDCDGHERRSRVKVTSEASDGMVVFRDTPMEEGSGVFFLTAHFVIPVSSLTPMEEVSGVFFLTAHFVIPVISLLWRKVLECSSSHCSLRYPCVLTHSYGGSFWNVLPHPAHFVIPVSSLTSLSLCSHTHDLSSHPSHRYP